MLRIKIGRAYYTFRRYIKWYFGKKIFAKTMEPQLYPVTVYRHQTPLLRQLRDVEMWLQHNKIKNLEIAARKINKIIIKPQETFSYWKIIGKPTRRKGYVKGMVLFYGHFRDGIGGGLCQLSNLIYWITLHSPLTVEERHRHSYDVFPDSNRTQPFGSGATCVYNYIDLQIKNNTNHTYQLHIYLTKENLIGEWLTVETPELSYEVYEKEHWITHELWGGHMRHNIIHRRTFNKYKEIINDEYITENHAIMMYQPFLQEAANSE